MKIQTRSNGEKDVTVLVPDMGKCLRRIADNMVFDGELWLGYTYYIGGVRLDEPLLELPEHYEEIWIDENEEHPEEPIEEEPIVDEEPQDPSETAYYRRLKVKESNAYAESLKSVSFYGQEIWKTPAERDNYLSTLQSAKRLGMEEIPFLGVVMPIDEAIRFIDIVNVWAFKVTATKEMHEANINALNSIEQVENYDYTIGYPEKIVIKKD